MANLEKHRLGGTCPNISAWSCKYGKFLLLAIVLHICTKTMWDINVYEVSQEKHKLCTKGRQSFCQMLETWNFQGMFGWVIWEIRHDTTRGHKSEYAAVSFWGRTCRRRTREEAVVSRGGSPFILRVVRSVQKRKMDDSSIIGFICKKVDTSYSLPCQWAVRRRGDKSHGYEYGELC